MDKLESIREALKAGTSGHWSTDDGLSIRAERLAVADFTRPDMAFAQADARLVILLRNSAEDLLAAIRAGEAWLKADDELHAYVETFDHEREDADRTRRAFRVALARLKEGT